ncbi:MAG: phosphonate ABC transporter substrate-binding protein [Paracoccus sp. (in: a-proteobacteria)]|uniref:phosphonate ABC transporter substrate-binding protein n=1 Tax=Paracoccus sp. TaxID=267 RepID=UPI00391D2EB3
MRLFAPLTVPLTVALATLTALPAMAQDWKTDYRIVRFGILSGENESDRIARYGPFQQYLEDTLGVEVEIFTAGNYDGVVQALAAGQIEFSFLGPSAYAAAYTETNGGVIPLLTAQQNDDSVGYYSVIATRCDAGYKTLDDLKGKTIAFADPDSASGYTIPYYNLTAQGYVPEQFFGAVPFSGSHEAGIMGVIHGQFDASATHWTNETAGNIQRMAEKGMIDADDICIVWTSPLIMASPFTARTNLPEGLIADMKAAVQALSSDAPEVFRQMTGGDASTAKAYVEVTHEQYQVLIDMRDWFKANRG